jgi:HAD superfamily hydrolase (TIGR01509 family)
MGAVAVGRVRAAELDAVTIDAYGTLMRLLDPVPTLVEALARHGVQRTPEVVHAGFQAEAAYYIPRVAEGQDESGLARLRQECAGVFLEAVKADLDAADFAPAYVKAMRFERMDGSVGLLRHLRALGLELAVVANWDLSLRERLEETGLAQFFSVVVHAARKPAPDGLLHALARLGVSPQRALHIGDEDSDEAAARAAGMRFERAPLIDAVARLR